MTFVSEFEGEDDDPLSIRSLSITLLGIVIAMLTISLPSISVLLSRPLSQGNEITFNYTTKQDGPQFNTSISNEGYS